MNPCTRGPRGNAPARRPPARGVSLIVAMLMLVIIGLMSAAIMRQVTLSERMADQRGLQAQALQRAQRALQFCERQLLHPQTAVVKPAPEPLDPPQWTVPANWYNPSTVHTLLPAESGGAEPPLQPPQCMAERSSASLPQVYTVTARGFSDDYRANAGHATLGGSVVWLQSVVQLGAAGAGS